MIELLFFLSGAFVGWAYTYDRVHRSEHKKFLAHIRRLERADRGKPMATKINLS
jgi:hypothetical protein